MPRARVLLVEDDPWVGSTLESALARRYAVHLAESVADAVRAAETFAPDLVAADYNLHDDSGRNGLDLLELLRRPGLLLTGSGHIESGAFPIVAKPVRLGALYASIEGVLQAARPNRRDHP